MSRRDAGISRRARRAPARLTQQSAGTRAIAARLPQMTEEEAVESMASTWRTLTVAWAAELRRLDWHDAAAKVLATRFCASFREQLRNERTVRETYWALPNDLRERWRVLDGHLSRIGTLLCVPWSSIPRNTGWTTGTYAAKAASELAEWLEELERSR
jgi:hypothetical protein